MEFILIKTSISCRFCRNRLPKLESLGKAYENIDKIFLLTPVDPRIVEFTNNLVREAKKNAVRFIIKLSTFGADTDPRITTTRLHRQVEKVIEQSEIPFTFLRPNSFMQNFSNFHASTIRNKNAFYVPGGDAKISFVDVRDIASTAAKILIGEDYLSKKNHWGKAYNITGPEDLSYNQVAEILSSVTGKKRRYINSSDKEARRGMEAMGIDEWFIKLLLELYNSYRKGQASQISDEVESITGNKPISFAQFAKDYSWSFN